ncbi:hypothetical protein ACFXB3_01240 [Streptomyces sp. NPDC059447]|uniref:hypothetical protein n=1 Tax=Streptomyces sp. NPDC059447 TaxID=3346834 RepID=UPI0036CAB537
MVPAEQSGLGALGVWDYLITSTPTPLEGIRDASASPRGASARPPGAGSPPYT